LIAKHRHFPLYFSVPDIFLGLEGNPHKLQDHINSDV
jgi:hypothetical protein